jgi:hypothetical protein
LGVLPNALIEQHDTQNHVKKVNANLYIISELPYTKSMTQVQLSETLEDDGFFERWNFEETTDLQKKSENIQIISDVPYTGSIPPVSFPSTSQGPESNTSGETNQTTENQPFMLTQIPVVFESMQTNFLKSPNKTIPTSIPSNDEDSSEDEKPTAKQAAESDSDVEVSVHFK